MTATEQPKPSFWEVDLTPEQQARIAARLNRAARKAVRGSWNAAK